LRLKKDRLNGLLYYYNKEASYQMMIPSLFLPWRFPRGFFPRKSIAIFALVTVFLPCNGEAEPAKDTAKPAPFRLGQATLGNVLLPADNPAIIPVVCEMEAEEITWTITDAWNCEVASGKAPKKEAVSKGLQITLPRPGWFLLKARALSNGTLKATAQTALTLFASAAPRDPDSAFGVMTHFGQHWNDDVLEVFAKMGASTIRDGIDWSNVETTKGEFTFPPAYDKALASAVKQGMTPLSVLAFGNDLYDRSEGIPAWAAAPYTPEGHAAYTRYCLALMKHFGNQAKLVEIWNEYNGGFARGPAAGQAKVYVEMLKTAYPAIKEKFPDSFALGCSTVGIPLTWIEEVFQHGGLAYMDGVSIHPYGYEKPPEVLIEKLAALKELIRKYNDGKDKPIWVTEHGYFTIEDGKKGNRSAITELIKGAYLVRSWTVFLGMGVEKIYWYLGKNYDVFATMGLVGSETDSQGRYAPKPSFTAYGVLTRMLDHATFLRREEGPQSVYSYLFQRGHDQVRVLWATEPQGVSFASAKSALFTDLMGNSFPIEAVNGKINLHLSQIPVYLTGTLAGEILPSEIAWKSPAVISQDEPATLQLSSVPLAGKTLSLITPCGSLALADDKTNPFFREAILPARKTTGELWIPFAVDSKGAAFFAGIKKIESRPAIRLDPFARLKNEKTLVVTARNASQTQPVRFVKAEWTVKGGPASGPLKLDTSVPPQTNLEIELPAPPIVPFTHYPLEISLTLANGEKLSISPTASYNPIPRLTVPFDKPVADWGLKGGISLAGLPFEKLEAPHAGEADLGGTIQLACDDEFLYIAASIRDDANFQEYFGFNTWRGDNIQIGISTEMPWASGEWENGPQEFSLAQTAEGPEFFETSGRGGLVADAKIVVTREGGVTTYRAALPWSAVKGAKPPINAFSFALFVNDNDGKGRKGYLQWGNIKGLDALQPFLVEPQKPVAP